MIQNNVITTSLPAERIQAPGFLNDSTDSINIPTNNPSPLKLILSPVNFKDYKKSKGERRITLSPATAKSMLICAIEEENNSENDPNMSNQIDDTKSEASFWKFAGTSGIISSKSYEIMTGKSSSNFNMSLPTDHIHMLKDLSKELDGILANNNELVPSIDVNDDHQYESRSLKDYLDGTDYLSPSLKQSDHAEVLEGIPLDINSEISSELIDSDDIIIDFDSQIDLEDNDSFELMESMLEKECKTAEEENKVDVINSESQVPHITIPPMFDVPIDYPSPNYPFPLLSPALSASIPNLKDPLPLQSFSFNKPVVPMAATTLLSTSTSIASINKSEQYNMEELEIKTNHLSITETIVNENISSFMIESNVEDQQFLPDILIDEKTAKELAYNRLGERFELARWKYQWEQVSFIAANTAIRKYRK